MRIYTSESDPIDFCRKHMPSEEKAFEMYGNLGDGPDGRGNCFSYDDEHPDYEDLGYDRNPYRCSVCGCRLTEKD